MLQLFLSKLCLNGIPYYYINCRAMKKRILSLFILLGALVACNDDDDMNTGACDRNVVINDDLYQTAPSAGLEIRELKIEDDCLFIDFGAHGCGVDLPKLKLIDAGVILESDPPQRNLLLSVEIDDTCDGYFIEEMTFNLQPLRVNGKRLWLNIKNSNDQILYEY